MRCLKCISLLIFFAALWSCNQSGRKEESNEPPGLKEGQISRESFGTCDTIKNSGVTVKIRMWLPAGSGNASGMIARQLNQKVIERINSYADSASIASNPAAKTSPMGAYEVFAKNYFSFKKQFKDAPGCWEVDLKGDTVMMTPKFLFYQLDHYSFAGGAHPNSFRSYHIFDIALGKERDAKTFVLDTAALKVKVEAAFKKVEKLPSDADLEEQGYFLSNHRFFLPANYVFTPEGILFYYNPYEIAPYARGVIKFIIPYNELEGIVKKEMVF